MSPADASPDAGTDSGDADSGGAPASLAGKRVVVTRAAGQSGELVGMLRRLGAEVVELPLIEIVQSPDNATVLAGELAAIDDYDWLVVTSPNGAACVCAHASNHPVRCKVAAVGAATAAALAPYAAADFVPQRANAAGLVAEFPTTPSGRALLVQGDLAPPLIADHLTSHGWDVTRIDAYSTVAARPDGAAIASAAEADAITFLSSSAVQAFADIVGIDRLPPVVVSIGPSTSATLREIGVTELREPASSSLTALVKMVFAALQSSLEST